MKMIIHNQKQQLEYLIKMRNKPEKSVEQMRKEFVNDFNKESKKQSSFWRAWILYEHLYIFKLVEYGWWIFKSVIRKYEFHIRAYNDTYSYNFVDNDYVFSDDGMKRNRIIFKHLPEIKPILEKIPQTFFILPFEEIKNFDLRFTEIKKRVEELEEKSQNGK